MRLIGMSAVTRLARTAGLVLGTGYVLFFFSERMFWSLWRPTDNVGDLVATWLFYCLAGYILLAVIRLSRAATIPALFLCGAVFGWLVEGVYAMTMYGDASLPFPFTISWTALAWHAPLSVVVGWYGLLTALQRPSPMPGIFVSAALGLFWGGWAVAWGIETPRIIASAAEFAAHGLSATLLLGIAQWTIVRCGLDTFHPSRVTLALATLPFAAFFVLVTVPTVPIAPLVLVPLLGLTSLALVRSARLKNSRCLLDVMATPVPRLNWIGLVAMPATATIVYATCNATGIIPPSHQIVCFTTTGAGFGYFAWAVYRPFQRRPPDPRAP
jgi:hypothetical protein